jgi:hypothetical protein
VLRGLFGRMRVGLTGRWRKQHSEELRDIRLIKSRNVKSEGHVARMREEDHTQYTGGKV